MQKSSFQRKRKILKSLKENLKLFFLNKFFFIFLIAFIVGDILFFFQYKEALQSFALFEKRFIFSDVQDKHAINLLSENFTCETNQPIPGCYNHSYVFIFLFILVELFLIYSIIKFRKTFSKKILIGYSLFLQLFFVFPLIGLIIAPYKSFDTLTAQANRDISNSAHLLTNKEILATRGIEDDVDEIRKKLEKQKDLPTLVEDNPKEQALLQTLEIKQNEKDSLYRVSILPYQIYYAQEIASEKENINFAVLLFPNNTLIIHSVSSSVIENLVPILASSINKSSFSKYISKISSAPLVDLPDEAEYLSIRKQEEEKIKRVLTSQIQEAINAINSLDKYIAETEIYLKDTEVEYASYQNYSKSWLSDCSNSFGSSHSFCQDGKKTIEESLRALEENKRQAENYLEEAKNVRPSYVESIGLAKQYYQNYINQPQFPELEAGVFVPPNQIHLKYQLSENYQFSYYLSTGIHEYLHFFSYHTSGDNSLPSFIDEGITDFLTTKELDEFLKKQTSYSGYPTEIEIIKGMTKLTSEEEIIDIYFSKNEKTMRKQIEDKLIKGGYDLIKTKGNLLSSVPPHNIDEKEEIKKEIMELLSPSTSISN